MPKFKRTFWVIFEQCDVAIYLKIHKFTMFEKLLANKIEKSTIVSQYFQTLLKEGNCDNWQLIKNKDNLDRRQFGPRTIWTGDNLDRGKFGPRTIWTQVIFGPESIWTGDKFGPRSIWTDVIFGQGQFGLRTIWVNDNWQFRPRLIWTEDNLDRFEQLAEELDKT